MSSNLLSRCLLSIFQKARLCEGHYNFMCVYISSPNINFFIYIKFIFIYIRFPHLSVPFKSLREFTVTRPSPPSISKTFQHPKLKLCAHSAVTFPPQHRGPDDHSTLPETLIILGALCQQSHTAYPLVTGFLLGAQATIHPCHSMRPSELPSWEC